jgi:hypothetical protein
MGTRQKARCYHGSFPSLVVILDGCKLIMHVSFLCVIILVVGIFIRAISYVSTRSGGIYTA